MLGACPATEGRVEGPALSRDFNPTVGNRNEQEIAASPSAMLRVLAMTEKNSQSTFLPNLI